jgi:exo-beta-1,3-glucanase (GH17 family)
MSKQHYYRELSLAGINLAETAAADIRSLVREVLASKIHGISFSPYLEGQGPGTIISELQIRERLAVIQPYVNWIRTFSCTEGHELIPGVAAEHGIKSMVGIWLDDDLEHNEQEISNALQLAAQGHANLLGVGNEVLLRGDLTEDQLLGYINRVKEGAAGVPVGYVDAYFEFEEHPKVTAACDVIFANCYPFWEGCPADLALIYMKEMYHRTVRAADGKPVIVSETGWPNKGTTTKGAVPSEENAVKYFVDTYQWAEEEGIEIFYFSAFDEAWKTDAEGDVGAFWGLWDKDGNSKYK